MYTDVDCYNAAGWLDQLREYEQEIGRPVRFLNGSGRTWANRAWSRSMVAACDGFSAAQCRDHGLTIISYGTMHPVSFRNSNASRYPGNLGLFPTGNRYETGTRDMWDMLDMPESSADWIADPFYVGDGAYLVGEIAERTILWALPWLNYGNASFDLLVKQPATKALDDEFLAGLVGRRATATRDAFVRYAARVSNAGLDAIRRDIGTFMAQHDRAVAEAARSKVELRQRQRLLDAVVSGDGALSEEGILETWAKLLDDPRIESVNFDSAERVVLTTVGLDITHPTTGDTVYLGKFKWVISADGTQMCEVHNLDNARGGFDHPHIHMNQPCFGELGSTIYTLIKQGNLYPAVELIFAFLASVNLDDDWGRRGAFWFEDPMDSPRNTTDELIEA